MNWLYATAFAIAAWLIMTRRDLAGPQAQSWWPPSDGAPARAGDVDQFDPDAGAVWQEPQDTVPDQLPSAMESFVVTAQEAIQSVPELLGYDAPRLDQSVQERNVAAFLNTIAYAEGTSGPDGYRTLFGGGLFDSYADHPRQYFNFRNSRGEQLKTSAAGRYQFLARTWDALRAKLNLADFGPAAQDLAAIELIRERGALGDVQAGRFAAAVAKCAPVWASLPGAGYAQPERKLSALLASYTAAGGNLES